MLLSEEAISVSELTAHVKDVLESDDQLADVRVRGEIGNITRPASGHLYFTLKDAQTQVKCVMWRSAVIRLRSVPRSGDAVVVRGRIGVYEKDGAYQLYAESLTTDGTGDLYVEFERLKRSLAAEGLFDEARKRQLPAFPRVLGVVTSPTGAALQDVLNVLGRRYPLIEVVLAPSLVQGNEAPAQIVKALHALNARGNCDVILVTRGGGSLEELWAFNDERVVRAVAASRAPVVSGVGHEIDTTLCDFAADMRAPTPSAAAELITPDAADLRMSVDALQQELQQVALRIVADAQARLVSVSRALRLLNPLAQVAQAKTRLNNLSARLDSSMSAWLELRGETVRGLAGRLATVGPQSTLARGYAIVWRKGDHSVVRSISDVEAGDDLTVRVADGEFNAQTRSK